ncbi:MAG: efflux RND transporter periplasmic adaptor subunit [Planctomycetaceae bacterium]|nr:MAG: efflux RND transporter periplasmic adaptor subunit [Planctomycetaceae bacterium]
MITEPDFEPVTRSKIGLMFRRLTLLVWGLPAALGCEPHAPDAERLQSPQAATTPSFENGIVRIAERSLRFLEIDDVNAEAGRAAVRAPGQIVFRDGAVAEIGAPVAGRVSEIHVRVGDRVEEGALLISLLSPEAASARAASAAADAEVRAARNELERQVRLREKGLGVQRDEFEAETRVMEAQAAAASAALAVAMLGDETGALVHIRAPISGMILDRSAALGASVDPGGETLLRIGDPAALWLMVDVFVDDLPLVQEGAGASIEVATIPHPLRGRVESVGAVLQTQLRRAPVFISIDEQQSANVALRHGMYARAQIEADVLHGVMVPASSVVIRDGRWFATYVEVREGGTEFEQRNVVVGQVVDDYVQVLSGLEPGERIVVRGALLLDGTADLLQ